MPPLTVASLATISTSRPATAPDARSRRRRRRVAVVHVPGRQRRQLEERRARIDELFDALAHRQLALLAMPLTGIWRRRPGGPCSAARDIRRRAPASDRGWREIQSPLVSICESKTVHHHPQQSVLNRHAGQRHTACMRYMSAPQRSHFIASSAGTAGEALSAETIGVISDKERVWQEAHPPRHYKRRGGAQSATAGLRARARNPSDSQRTTGAMIDTGTPSNHATPYFISSLPSDNSVI